MIDGMAGRRGGLTVGQRFSISIPESSTDQVAAVTPSSRSSRLRTRPTGLRGSSARNSM